MLIEESKINGVKIITAEPRGDKRGYFVREFCQKELACVEEDLIIRQINHSKTVKKGTVRGLHFQRPPHTEIKIVRCTKGSIYDVAVDIRRNSPTFLQWHGEILSEENMKMLVVPEGFAHGFMALEDNVEMFYYNTAFYNKESEGALRYDDPKVVIDWPLKVTVVSQKDSEVKYIDDNFEGILL